MSQPGHEMDSEHLSQMPLHVQLPIRTRQPVTAQVAEPASDNGPGLSSEADAAVNLLQHTIRPAGQSHSCRAIAQTFAPPV